MNRSTTDDPTVHPDELLPWYANGTLGEAEHAQVAAHVADCAHCRDELALLTVLRAEVRTAGAATAPGEFGLKRLLREVDAGQEPDSQRHAARSWWRSALAVAAILIIAMQGVMITHLYQETTRFTPLGGPAVPGTVVQIRFHPSARAAQIRAALQAVDGSMISGPGALGVYQVRLAGLAAGSPAVAERIAALRARHGVIEYVAKD